MKGIAVFECCKKYPLPVVCLEDIPYNFNKCKLVNTVHFHLRRKAAPRCCSEFRSYRIAVDVKIKQALELAIRIPEWVEPDMVACTVNGAVRQPRWDGRYAVFGSVLPGDSATMTFPILEREDVVTVMKKKYTLVRKGNTVVDIDPPGRYAPLFQRRHFRQNQTRWRIIERFLSPEILPW